MVNGQFWFGCGDVGVPKNLYGSQMYTLDGTWSNRINTLLKTVKTLYFILFCLFGPFPVPSFFFGWLTDSSWFIIMIMTIIIKTNLRLTIIFGPGNWMLSENFIILFRSFSTLHCHQPLGHNQFWFYVHTHTHSLVPNLPLLLRLAINTLIVPPLSPLSELYSEQSLSLDNNILSLNILNLNFESKYPLQLASSSSSSYYIKF